jgi:hypothetical protein
MNTSRQAVISIFWNQKIQRYFHRSRNLCEGSGRTVTAPCFKVRQITLAEACLERHFKLRHPTPFAQRPDRILTGCKTINNSLRQQDFPPGFDLRARLTHQAGGAHIFVGRPRHKTLVFTLRQDREFLATRCLDELNLGHVALSFIDFAAMPDSDDDKRVVLDIEDNAPVADPQSRTIPALEPLHVPVPGLRERREPCLKSSSHVDGEPKPLARGRSGPNDLHRSNIAYRDIGVKTSIAHRDGDVVE